MACRIEFIEALCELINRVGSIRYRKMFGEYMIYANDKPIILVCDNTAFVKILPELSDVLQDAEKGVPYPSAKEHYILDTDRKSLINDVARILEKITTLPKSKTNKAKDVKE